MPRSQAGWTAEFQRLEAWWTFGGEPRPNSHHALLHAGDHSNGFFLAENFMEDPMLMHEATFDLIDQLRNTGLDLETVDRCIGPAYGAITLAHDGARQITFARNSHRHCLRAFATKVDELGKEFLFKKTKPKAGERVLLWEDALTTGDSSGQVKLLAEKFGCEVLPYILCLLNRTGKTEVNGMKIIALVHKHLQTWEPGKCPHCAAGSIAIRPKEGDNWNLLKLSAVAS